MSEDITPRQPDDRLDRLFALVQNIAASLSDLSADVAELKGDVAELKGDVAELKEREAARKLETAGKLDKLIADVAETREELRETREELHAFKTEANNRFDTIERSIESSLKARNQPHIANVIEIGHLSARILEMEMRLDKLEGK